MPLYVNVWDLLPTPGKVPGESTDPILQTWRIKKNFGDKWSQWVDFIEELWPRGRWHWQIKKKFSDTSYNRLQTVWSFLQNAGNELHFHNRESYFDSFKTFEVVGAEGPIVIFFGTYGIYVPMYFMYACKQNNFPGMDNKIELN